MPVEPASTARAHAPYFVALAVENLRCFREPQALLLSRDGAPARFTLVLGDHGTGKTTLLQMLATLRPQFRAAPGAAPALDGADWPGLYWSSSVRTPPPGARAEHASLSAVLAFRKELTGDTALVDGLAQSYPPNAPAVLERNLLSPGLASLWPCTTLVIAYGAHRRLHVGRPLPPPTLATNVAHLFDSDSPLIPCEEWFIDRADAIARSPREGPEHARARDSMQRVRAALLSALPELESLDVERPEGPDGSAELLARTAYGRVHVTRLGHAAQGTLAWLTDLCARMTAHYAKSEDPLSEPAVVLIDEPELHVHPRRVGALIASLAKSFPNVQWVMSTKSPAVVRAAPREERHVALLRRDADRVVIDNAPGDVDEATDPLVEGALFSTD